MMIPGITAHILQGGGIEFTNLMQTFVGGDYTAATWTTIGLSTYGVPADAVCIFITGNDDANDFWNQGVREVGSSLSRFVPLTEGESGGASWATFWVQADASSQVQIYTEESNNAQTFSLIGYFSPEVTFTERFDNVISGWTQVEAIKTLSNPAANDLINIMMGNTNTAVAQFIGCKEYSDVASNGYIHSINEAEAGGGEYYNRSITLNASKQFKVRAASTTTMVAYDMGTISGMTYVGLEDSALTGNEYTASAASTWVSTTLGNTEYTPQEGDIVEVICRLKSIGTESLVGVRDTSETALNRYADVHESESGGATFVVLYATVDASDQIDLYAELNTSVTFWITGYFRES